MSGGGFHVHGPHDHEVEHAEQHDDRMAGLMPVCGMLGVAVIGIALGIAASLHL